MLLYHAAYDPYHAAFRLLRIFNTIGESKVHYDALRIMDFYLTFPALISRIRFPKEHLGWKRKFIGYNNPYHFTGQALLVFKRMEIFQEKAIRLLHAKGLISEDEADTSFWIRSNKTIPSSLALLIGSANEQDTELMIFIRDILGGLSLYGENGIKARSGLMEFKYDAI